MAFFFNDSDEIVWLTLSKFISKRVWSFLSRPWYSEVHGTVLFSYKENKEEQDPHTYKMQSFWQMVTIF